MKVLILGAAGMIGNGIYRALNKEKKYDLTGTCQELHTIQCPSLLSSIGQLRQFSYGSDNGSLISLLQSVSPDFVINCIGLVKQSESSSNILSLLRLNSELPQMLALLSDQFNYKLIQVSTDCVFSGASGMYVEEDVPDAFDAYGRSKWFGETSDSTNVLTIRASVIGHEPRNKYGLLDWFLSQDGVIQGFKEAYFSGLSSLELGTVINKELLTGEIGYGLCHVSGARISKYEFLNIVKEVFEMKVELIEKNTPMLDRSLNSCKFRKLTGYNERPWFEMLEEIKNTYRVGPQNGR